MNLQRLTLSQSSAALAVLFAGALSAQAQFGRAPLVVTSTNDASENSVVVFKLQTGESPSLSLSQNFHTGAKGGAAAGAEAGIVQFRGEFGAVANNGSNSVSQLARAGDSIVVTRNLPLASDCVKPDSVALTDTQLFVVGANCAETHAWPSGYVDGPVASLTDTSAAQIAAGDTWAAVTLTSGSLLQLPLTREDGVLTGTSTSIPLPSDANNTPLGEAFWGDVLAFTPAHSVNSFAIVDAERNLSAVPGPSPAFPTNAPCWVAKGPGSIWYTGNSPGHAIAIFFSDGQSAVFYKNVPLAGSPTDVAVSPDKKWLAVIYTAGNEGYVEVFSIDAHGDLTAAATSSAIGVASFDGVAFSE